MEKKENLYHIHRSGNSDELWYVGNKLKIDDSFNSMFYVKLLQEEKKLIEKYGDYDIDYIIARMEELKLRNLIDDNISHDFDELLNRYYFLRREKALEEGRKLFNPHAPSRLHSIFLTDEYSKDYWIKKVGGDELFQTFLLEFDGNIFVSSDDVFPDYNFMFDIQVEQSKEYWKPKIKQLLIHKEFVFQGNIKIID